jgi:hypothetical protein
MGTCPAGQSESQAGVPGSDAVSEEAKGEDGSVAGGKKGKKAKKK